MRAVNAKKLPRHDDMTLEAYAWPGGYPLFYFDNDDGVLCVACAREADKAWRDGESFSYWPVNYDVNWEDPFLYCDNCSQQIESAYHDNDCEGCELCRPGGED